MADIFIGTAGFSYKDWEGIVYPADLRKRKIHPLEYLAQFFDCCEINTSFYGHIKPEVGKHWAEMVAAVNSRFLFTAKLNQAFTHSPLAVVEATSAETLRPLPEDETLAKAGLNSLANSGRLGALLIQFPISFKNTSENRAYLEKLFKKFAEYPLVLEVRHATWNDPIIFEQLAEQGIGFANIDQPILGNALCPSSYVTSHVGYVRLHGRNYKQWFESEHRNDRYNYLYTHEELKGWTERVKQVSKDAKKTFVITNNHPDGKAAVSALEIAYLLTGKKVKSPATLVEKYPSLKPFAETLDLEIVRRSEPAELL
ncbi:MAG TPA: DUF72 domain-containing protein [Terriglobales bacterium]|nr:DUF72 domain-containing protein [Terriglobales bacterium]